MAQLFITNFEKEDQRILIKNSEISYKLKKVLRAEKSYIFFIQPPFFAYEKESCKRYKVSLTKTDNDEITAKILHYEKFNINYNNKWFLIPILNNLSKMELIVQKLSEIWIENIIFWKSEYSQISYISQKRMQRFFKISLEGVQQSKWLFLPKIEFIEDLKKYLNKKNIILFEKWYNKKTLSNWIQNDSYWIVWPEAGFSSKEKDIIDQQKITKISLSSNILKSETATIIGGRILQNL